MKKKLTKQPACRLAALVAEHEEQVRAKWAELEQIITALQCFSLDNYYAFNTGAEILLRLLFLAAKIKPTPAAKFALLCDLFARYLEREHQTTRDAEQRNAK